MRYLVLTAAIALAACQPSAQSPAAPSGIQAEVALPSVAIQQGSMLGLLNSARTGQGLGAVSEDARLSRAALDHALDMERNGYFSHEGRNGSSFSDRARAAGYACAAAENIAFGQSSEAEVMTEWMNSAGHRRNILLADAVDFGIGRVGNMWVLMMGRSGC